MNDAVVSVLTVAFFTSIGVTAAYPQLAHLVDSGSEEIPLERLPSKKESSRNLKVRGVVRDDLGIELTTTYRRKKYKESHSEVYFPFVGEEGRDKPIVHVVLEVSDMSRLRPLLDKGQPVTIQGTLRNVAWEGVPSKVRDAFVAGGQPLADDVVLFQMGRPHDVERALGYPLAGALVGVLTVIGARSKSRKKSTTA